MRTTNANALVPECHVEVWSDLDAVHSVRSAVSGVSSSLFEVGCRFPTTYSYIQARVVPNSSMYQEAVAQKGFSRLAPAFDGGVRQVLLVVSRSAICLLEKAGRT